MIIDCISDLHGHFPKLEGGDLLIIAGDLTARGTEPEFFDCFDWIHAQPYRKKILIAGNHDMQMQEENYRGPVGELKESFEYLCDSGTEFDGLKIWGSPWTLWFKGINPHCAAFTVKTDEELKEKWDLIPEDTDILITHCPAYGFGDEVTRVEKNKITQFHSGSKALLNWVSRHVKTLKLHVHGHIHEGYGKWDVRFAKKICGDDAPSPILVNASHVDAYYEPVNKPIRITL